MIKSKEPNMELTDLNTEQDQSLACHNDEGGQVNNSQEGPDSLKDSNITEGDLEDGEIEDDDEDAVESAAVDDSFTERGNDSTTESESYDKSNKKSHRNKSERSKSSRDKHGKKRKHKSKHSDLDADEEKKRRLKEKLAALEKQMAADDEAMGVYGNGGLPNALEDGDYSDESDAASLSSSQRSRSSSPVPQRRKRNHRDSHEEVDRKKRRDDRHHRRRDNEKKEKSTEICKLYMQGKCPKNPDNCMYSHDAEPPKIMELCKFYLFERCAKREKCLYLHKGFPCKYYHTGVRCLDTAESCKFSHEPLTDEIRAILLKHLEMAPKEILGDFPRMNRDQAVQMVMRTEAKHKAIPIEELTDPLDNPDTISRPVPQMTNANNANTIPLGEKRRRSRWGDGQADLPFPPAVIAPGGPPMIPPQLRPGDKLFKPPGPRSDMGGFMNAAPQMIRPGPGPGSILGPRPQPYLMRPQGPDPFRMRPPGFPPMGHMPPMTPPNDSSMGNSDIGEFNPNHPPPNRGPEDQQMERNGLSQKSLDHPQDPNVQQRPVYERDEEHQQNIQSKSNAFKLNDHWYSSDEDDNESNGATRGKKPESQYEGSGNSNVTLPKELNDVISSIRKDSTTTKHVIRDPRISRDPRSNSQSALASDSNQLLRDPRKKSSQDPANIPSEREKDKRLLEMDLGSVFGDLELPTFKESSSTHNENDPLGLPFKPYHFNAAAKEIDASIYSHSPLEYKLRPVLISGPDYSDVISIQRIPLPQAQQDPRLRKFAARETHDPTGAYSPTQQTFDLRHKDASDINSPLIYNPNSDLNKGKVSEQKLRRRDPRRRD